jgi:hypothetical protein
MPNYLTYLSVLNPEFSSTNASTSAIQGGAGDFGYVHFLNLPVLGGGSAAASFFSDGGGVSWGTAGSVVTATVKTDYAASTHTHTWSPAVEWYRGVAVSASPPSPEIQYSDWTTAGTGYWGWISIP